MSFDLLIRGAHVVPGDGPAARLDVGVADGRIAAVEPDLSTAEAAEVVHGDGLLLCPGFIDAQLNGGRGIDLTTEPGRADELGRFLPRYGVTSFLPTIITCADEQRTAALTWWAERDGRRLWHTIEERSQACPILGASVPGAIPMRPFGISELA